MHAYIVAGANAARRTEWCLSMLDDLSVTQYARFIVEGEEGSIGIAAVRRCIAPLSLSTGGRNQALVISDAHLLTTEAQQAFLKTIEEPPPNTYVFLLVSDEELLLPTIASRCITKHMTMEKGDDGRNASQHVHTFLSGKRGDRLMLLGQVTDRESCSALFDALARDIHETVKTEFLIKTGEQDCVSMTQLGLRLFQLRRHLDHNISPRLLADMLFLGG